MLHYGYPGAEGDSFSHHGLHHLEVLRLWRRAAPAQPIGTGWLRLRENQEW